MSVVTGSVPLPNNQKLSEQPSIRDFGGKGDGVTNNVAAFSRAVAGLPVGGTLFLPRGDYLLKGSGTELILVNKPISIVGEGWMTRLLIDPTVPATTDVIRLYNPGGAVIENYWGMRFANFYVKAVSGTPARHTFVIDATDGHFSRMTIRDLSLFPMNATGSGIRLINPTRKTSFFTSVIGPTNVVFGGIYLPGCGDSVIVIYNTLLGANAGVFADLERGSSELLIQGNNITSEGGAVHILYGNRIKILYNNIENPTANNSANHAMIDIDGIPGYPCVNCEVRGNFLGADVIPDIDCIRVNWADYCFIDANTMAFAGTGHGVNIRPPATNTILGNSNNAVSSPLAWLLDNASLMFQTHTLQGALSGAALRFGHHASFGGFTGSWADLNNNFRLLSGTFGSTIVVALDTVTGPFPGGSPVVVNYNNVAHPVNISGGSVSAGIITMTTATPHDMVPSATAPNTGYGYHTLEINGFGGDNTAIGYNVLASAPEASRNTGVGSAVMEVLTTGNDNTIVGALAGTQLTIGLGNTAVGSQTLTRDAGNSNTAVGTQALQLCTGGTNVAVGASAGANVTTGGGNVLVGPGAGFNLNIGSFNVCVGGGAGQTALESGSYNVCLGNGAQVSGTNAQYQVVIGAGAFGAADHTITLGTAAESIVLPSLISAPALGTDAGGKVIPVSLGTPSLATASAAATSNLSPLTGTMQDVPGATVSLAAGVWLVMGVFEFNINAGGAGSGGLNVGGTLKTALAVVSTDSSAAIPVSASQTWVVTVVGTQTAKLQAAIGGLAAGNCSLGNTTINCVKVG